MTDKTARTEVVQAHRRLDWTKDQIDNIYALREKDLLALLQRHLDLQHKFDLLMEYLNTEEVEVPAVPAVPAYKKIQKVKK